MFSLDCSGRSRGGNQGCVSMSHRVQLDFSEAAFKELENLQAKANAPTKAAAIRNALAVYKWFVDTVENKNDILVRTPTGETERIRFVGSGS